MIPVGLHTLIIILAPYPGLQQFLLLTPVFPPAAYNHNDDIREVEQHKEGGFPRVDLPIQENDEQRSHGNDEKRGIPQEGASIDPEGFDDAHGTHDAGDDERRRAQKLADGQASRICTQGRECREDVGAAIAERKEGDARDVLVQAQKLRNCC